MTPGLVHLGRAGGAGDFGGTKDGIWAVQRGFHERIQFIERDEFAGKGRGVRALTGGFRGANKSFG